MEGSYREAYFPEFFSPVIKRRQSGTLRVPVVEEGCSPRSESILAVKSETAITDNVINAGLMVCWPHRRSLKEVLEKRKELYESLPPLPDKFVRRYKKQVYEYVLAELLDDNFPEAYAILKKFITIDNELRKKNERDYGFVFDRPPLKDNVFNLKILASTLKQSEFYKNEDMREPNFTLLINMAMYWLKKEDKSWNWLIYELLQLAWSQAKGYIRDQGYGEALITYLFGKFILQELPDDYLDEAIDILNVAYGISIGKSWTADTTTGNAEEIIYMETCYLLNQALISKAKIMVHADPIVAKHLARLALKRLKETGRHPDIEDAIMERAMICHMAREPIRATSLLTGLSDKYLLYGNYLGACNALLLLSLCYKQLKLPTEAHESLEKLKELSEANNILPMIGIANRYIGERYLTEFRYTEAEVHLQIAYKAFLELKMYDDVDITCGLVGLARAYNFFWLYCRLIRKLFRPKSEKWVKTVLDWRINRMPFWEMREDRDVHVPFRLQYPPLPQPPSGKKRENFSLPPTLYDMLVNTTLPVNQLIVNSLKPPAVYEDD